MARTDKYPGQSHAGVGLISGKQGLYEASSTRRHTVGERLCLGDGRVFRYAKMGSTATKRPGLMLAADVDAANADTSVTMAIGEKDEPTFTTVGACGPAVVGGTFGVTTGTGAGQSYKIAGVSPGTTSSTSTIHLHDGVRATITTATAVLANNPFYGVEIPVDGAQMMLGAALIIVPANQYFWLQTFGWIAVVRGDSLGDLAGERELQASGVTALATANGALGAQAIGYSCYNGMNATDTEWHIIFLTIWP